MRKVISWLGLGVCVAALAVGCGDAADGGGGNGSGGDAGNNGMGGNGGGGAAVMLSGKVCADGAEDESTKGNGGDECTPGAGATVEVVGGASTTADANGDFSVEAVPGTRFVHVSMPAGFVGIVSAVLVPSTDVSELEFGVLAEAQIAGVENALQRTVDDGKGIVGIEIDGASGLGGETATLSVNSEFSFVFTDDVEGNSCVDDEGPPVVSSALLPNDCGDAQTDLIVVNVDASESVTITPTGNASVDCALVHDLPHPVRAATITEVKVLCTPVGN